MDKMLQKYPQLLRYKRSVIAHPGGAIVHDGDCGLYSIKICTCGLHHTLLPINEEDIKQIYPKYFAEQDGKIMVENLLQTQKDCGPELLSDKEIEEILIKKNFTTPNQENRNDRCN